MLNARSRRDYTRREKKKKSCQQSMKSFCAHTRKVPTVKEHNIDYVLCGSFLWSYNIFIVYMWQLKNWA